MKAYELTSWLEKKYPSDAAEDWDNVGLLAGDDTNEISHVFLALDLTEETLAEVKQLCERFLSHGLVRFVQRWLHEITGPLRIFVL